MAHVVGWSIARGGSQRITEALVAKLREAGGELETNAPVNALADLPAARAVLLDLSPSAFVRLAGTKLHQGAARRFNRFRHGMAVHKVDWALDAEVPWRDASYGRAGSLHLGGSATDVAIAERDTWAGRLADRPFILLSQPSRFDATRAPAGQGVLWVYAHVPLGYPDDLTDHLEARIEELVPGFRDCVRALCGYFAARRALAELFPRRSLTTLALLAANLRARPLEKAAADTRSAASAPSKLRFGDAHARS